MKLSITVLVCVRNGDRYLREALESVAAQTRPPDELLVIDDGSTDESASIAICFGARVISTPPRGIGAARNLGFNSARHEAVVVLDADDVLLATAIERLEAQLIQTPALAGVSAHRRSFVSPDYSGAIASFEADALPSWLTAGSIWRRGVALEYPFDESIESTDVDWVARLRAFGQPIEAIDEVLWLRRIHADNTSRRAALRAGYLRTARAAIERRRGAANA